MKCIQACQPVDPTQTMACYGHSAQHEEHAMETMIETGVCYGGQIDGTPSMQLCHLYRLYCALQVGQFFQMMLQAFNEPGYLEKLTGLDKLYDEGEAALETVDWDEEDEGDM